MGEHPPCGLLAQRAAPAHPATDMAFRKPTGFRLDTDSWVKEYNGCKDITQEIVQLIQVPRPARRGPFCGKRPWRVVRVI